MDSEENLHDYESQTSKMAKIKRSQIFQVKLKLKEKLKNKNNTFIHSESENKNLKTLNMEKEFKKFRKFIESLSLKQNNIDSKIKSKIVYPKDYQTVNHYKINFSKNPLFNNSLLNKMTCQNELVLIGKELGHGPFANFNSFKRSSGLYYRHDDDLKNFAKNQRNFLTPEATIDDIEKMINNLKPKLQEKSSFKNWQVKRPLEEITSRREFFRNLQEKISYNIKQRSKDKGSNTLHKRNKSLMIKHVIGQEAKLKQKLMNKTIRISNKTPNISRKHIALLNWNPKVEKRAMHNIFRANRGNSMAIDF